MAPWKDPEQIRAPLRGDIGRVKAGWREDAEGKLVDPEAHSGELLAGSWSRRARRWLSDGLDTWTPRLDRAGKWLKAVATVGGLLSGLVGFVWRAVVYYRTRGIAPAEQRATGIASTTVDRVPESKPRSP